MGRRAGSAIGVVLIIVSFLVFPLVLDSFDDIARSESSNAATVVTGVGVTSGDITLHNSLYNDAVTSVDNITSTDTDDVPLAASYTTATKELAVSGLEANSTRTITVTYNTERDDYSLSTIAPVTPLIIFICLLFSGIAMLWRSWR